MDYDSDGILRAEWPNSGHFELTPMLWTTMHWTRFVKPGWRALPCTDASVPTGRCALAGGGNCECCIVYTPLAARKVTSLCFFKLSSLYLILNGVAFMIF